MLAFDASVPQSTRARVVGVLGAAVLAISASAVLVRGMDAEAPAIAAWRCTLAAVLLSPSLRGALGSITRADALRMAGAGVFLGLHFVSWFASLEHTTVMRSTLLVCLTPVWAGLVEWLGFGQRPKNRFFTGVGVAVAGVVALAAFGEDGGTGGLLGDGLAILGGVLAALYMLVGRSVRQRVGVMPYMSLVCTFAALTAWPYALASGVEVVGFPPMTWVLLAGAVIGPQLIGHQGLSYAVRYIPASVVSSLTLLEPVGATVLAGLAFGEWPGPQSALAAGVVLVGVVIAARE